MKIKIHSHTDSRGSHAYNQKLSLKRAQSTKEYLIGKGVNPSRLSVKGYGENQLVNKCSDNVICSEEEHKQNRSVRIYHCKIKTLLMFLCSLKI